MLLSLTLPLLLAPLTMAADVQKVFVGRGEIHVLNYTSFDATGPADKIGCLNEFGLLTFDDCAVFTRKEKNPAFLASPLGGACSFRNQNMPTNKDSYYGKDSHAWSCRESPADNLEEVYYTVRGFNYPFICNGNLGCTYDIPNAPTPERRVQPVWQFFWGSHQMGITPGHLEVVWLWVPVGKGDRE
ncbi:hypothetical protein QBC35DRAFT_229987 [Podospora australis]|uniref:Uncharacterized protein n=1 Tax=Podospora australis TaxID=1536484 RepID=A0AAN7AJA3_9PEZI|nr:hypothetical protein QBC35DRAFT_229987 [Podospora australis]